MKLPKPYRWILGILLFSGLPFSLAQQTGQGGGGGGTTTGTTDNTSRKDTPARPQTNQSQPNLRIPEQPAPELIFISGDVMLEDGSVPPFGAVIELDCSGVITREASVEPNGRFSFQAGKKDKLSTLMPDASEGFNRDSLDSEFFSNTTQSGMIMFSVREPISRRLMGCEVRAQLAGYRSTTLRLDGGPLFGQNEIGTIVMYPVSRVRGSGVSLTTLMAPKPARKSLEQAKKALQKQKYGEAEALLESAVEAYPKFAEAWDVLGQVYHQQQRIPDARDAYARAMNIDKFYIGPYFRLAQIALSEKKWQDAADLTDQGLALDPITYPEAQYINAVAYYYLDKLDQSEKSARLARRLDSSNRFPKLFLLLSNILARKNDSAGSIAEMRNYLKYAPEAPDADLVRALVQEKEKLAKAAERTQPHP
jgi:hypothetical protein